jgi:predicted ATPase/DNA-binding XRE family transcriptional regulator
LTIRGTEDKQVAAALESAKGFSDLLRRYRLGAGLTQEDLSARAGLSARTISDLERGIHKSPFRYTVQAIARALDLAPEQTAALDASVTRARATANHVEPPPAGVGVPRPLLPIFGRESEISICMDLLARHDVRLLTLTGIGGVGKTRLALELGQRLSEEKEVSFVRLEGVEGREGLLPAIALGLGLTDAGLHAASLVESISLRVSGRPVVLILDSFESAMESRWEILDLLERSPEIQALITSRRATDLPGEHTFLVEPLPIGGTPEDFTLEEIESSAAVQMFVGLVTTRGSGFELTSENARIVQRIISRLDGLPLAIELAAGQTSVLTVQEILAGLTEGSSALEPVRREPTAARRSIADSIARSYALLPPSQQRLLRFCSVFPEDWTLDRLAAFEGRTASPQLMEPLLSRGFVQRTVSDDGRSHFRMLRLVKDFMRAELHRAGEADVAYACLAAFLDLIIDESAIELQVLSSSRPEALLDSYERDLQAALEWLLDSERIADGVRLLWRVRYWLLHSKHRTLTWLEAARNAPQTTDSITGAMISALIAAETTGLGRFSRAEGLVTTAISDLRVAGLHEEARQLLLLVAWAPVLEDDLRSEADLITEEALREAPSIERYQVQAARAARRLREGNYEGSEQDALAIMELDSWLTTHTDPRLLLGAALLIGGNNAEAHIVLSAAVDALRGRFTSPAPFVFALMGVASQRSGDESRASAEYGAALHGARQLGSIHPFGLCFVGAAWLASQKGRWEDAATLLGASNRSDLPHQIRDALGMEPELADAIRGNLDPAVFEASYRSAMLLPLDGILNKAKQYVEPPRVRPRSN